MMKHHGTRSLTGALFRMRRVQCALLLMTAAMVSAAGMVGCAGSGRFEINIGGIGTGVFQWETARNPGPSRGTFCGNVLHDGRMYNVYCDANGQPIYAQDQQSGRWFRLTPMSEAPLLPPHFPGMMINGVEYVLPPDPEVLELSAPSDLSAAEIAGQWGTTVGRDGTVFGAAAWSYDRSADVLDVTISADWSVGLPNPWQFQLGYELLVVSDDTGGVLLHRVVGARAEVAAYMEAMGASLTELDIDGVGSVPPAFAWLERNVLQALQAIGPAE